MRGVGELMDLSKIPEIPAYTPTTKGWQRCLLCGATISTKRGAQSAHEKTRRHTRILSDMLADFLGAAVGHFVASQLKRRGRSARERGDN